MERSTGEEEGGEEEGLVQRPLQPAIDGQGGGIDRPSKRGGGLTRRLLSPLLDDTRALIKIKF
jgi:hypothetical protein